MYHIHQRLQKYLEMDGSLAFSSLSSSSFKDLQDRAVAKNPAPVAILAGLEAQVCGSGKLLGLFVPQFPHL